MTISQTSGRWFLSDGSELVDPQPTAPTALRLRQWVRLGSQPYRIVNLRAIGLSRLVEFRGHAPVLVTAERPIYVFSIAPPQTDPDPYLAVW